MRVALDAMGGDKGPLTNVIGAIDAIRENEDLTVLLVGDKDILKGELGKQKYNPRNIEIVHAPEVIQMDDSPAAAVRKKRQSSLHLANQLVKEGEAEAVFTAGNTGAAMGVSLLTLGRIPGVMRPALLINFPSIDGNGAGTSLLDAGANVDSKPKMLAQFAVMGSLYVQHIIKADNPKVGLLSVGEEASKGNELIRESQGFFKNLKDINFIGNIEGQDVLTNKADVVVCDGFIGNITLKFAEGSFRFFGDILKREMLKSGWLNKIAAAAMMPIMRRIYRKMDYKEYGGAPLLGVNGISAIGHGKSTSKAIKNALLQTVRFAEVHINHKIEASLVENGVAE